MVFQALEFRALAEHGTVFYDAPSAQARKLFVGSRGMPLEVLIENRDWLRVRDQSGALAWVEKKALSDKRSVVVAINKAEVRVAADASPACCSWPRKACCFSCWKRARPAGSRSKHRDGAIGFIRIEEVWGV